MAICVSEVLPPPTKLMKSHSAFDENLMKSIRVFDMLRDAPGAVSGAIGTGRRGQYDVEFVSKMDTLYPKWIHGVLTENCR